MQDHLETLRKKYHSVNVTVLDDALVYFGLHNEHLQSTEDELNKIIKENNLPLVAKKNSGLMANTVVVEYLIK